MAERIHDTVTHARATSATTCEWSPRTRRGPSIDFLCRVVEIAIKAGATTINIPDTVGYTAPREYAELIRMLIERVPGVDKVGLRDPLPQRPRHGRRRTAWPAVEAGARQIECTINGIGERAGNTALEEVVMALRVAQRHHAVSRPASTRRRSCRRAGWSSTVTGLPVQRNKAIVGKNAFAHESGIHQDGMLKNAQTYEIMRPEDVGAERDEPGHGQALGAGGAARASSRSWATSSGTTSCATSSCGSRRWPTRRRRSTTTTSSR